MSAGGEAAERGDAATRYHHGDLARAALDAALLAVEAEGAGALSLRQVATIVGVTHKALYRHYEDREALLAAVATRGYELLASDLVRPGRDKADFCRAYVRFALGRPRLYEAMMRTAKDHRSPALGVATQAVIDAARCAVGSDREVKRAWIVLHGGLSLHAAGALAERSEDDLASFLIDLLER